MFHSLCGFDMLALCKYPLLSLSIALLTFAACTPQTATNQDTLVVTIEPLRYFVSQMAGEHFRVVSMVPKGSSPETYDPTPAQLVNLTHCRAYLAIGYIGFEQTWMARLQETAPQMVCYNLSEGVNLLENAHHHHGQASYIDPHLWLSTQNMQVIVTQIYAALVQLDNTHSDFYAANRDRLLREIAQTDATIREVLSQPHDTHFLIYHPALTYFAHDYQLTQLTIEEEGKEPSASSIRQMIDACQTHHVRVVFVQQEFDIRHAKMIATDLNANVVTINPLHYDWSSEMIRIAQALKK